MLMSRNQIRRCSALIPFTRQCIVTLLSVFNALTIVPAVLDNYKSTTALSVNMVNLACVLFINNFTCNDRNYLITCNMHTYVMHAMYMTVSLLKWSPFGAVSHG